MRVFLERRLAVSHLLIDHNLYFVLATAAVASYFGLHHAELIAAVCYLLLPLAHRSR